MFQLGCATRKCVQNEVLSGLTVALALVPEAVAFAVIAGVPPLVGLYAAFMVGLLAAIFGGRPGMISGATGAMAVVIIAMLKEIQRVKGAMEVDQLVQYLFAAIILTGFIQISAGLLKLGKFIRMVPYTVMLGFVNGLAIVIFLSQLDNFHEIVPHKDGSITRGGLMGGSALAIFCGLTFLTMLIIYYLQKTLQYFQLL